jgi:hypothetical protein
MNPIDHIEMTHKEFNKQKDGNVMAMIDHAVRIVYLDKHEKSIHCRCRPICYNNDDAIACILPVVGTYIGCILDELVKMSIANNYKTTKETKQKIYPPEEAGVIASGHIFELIDQMVLHIKKSLELRNMTQVKTEEEK